MRSRVFYQQHMHQDSPQFEYCDATGKKEPLLCVHGNETLRTFQPCRMVVAEAHRHYVLFETACIAGAVVMVLAVKLRNRTVSI